MPGVLHINGSKKYSPVDFLQCNWVLGVDELPNKRSVVSLQVRSNGPTGKRSVGLVVSSEIEQTSSEMQPLFKSVTIKVYCPGSVMMSEFPF